MNQLKVGDLVHAITGKQTGELVEINGDKGKVKWGVMDGQPIINEHPLVDLYKSDFKPPEKKEGATPEVNRSPVTSPPASQDSRTGYGDKHA